MLDDVFLASCHITQAARSQNAAMGSGGEPIPDSHIIWAGSGFYLAVSGIHLIRFYQIKTRSEIELAQTQSF